MDLETYELRSSTKSFDLDSALKNIPDQMAFKIGDVADLLEIKPYVLRYWEQEFKALNPKKAVNNQRIYSRRDVETAILIKKFLYVDQFSIPGAIKALREYKEKKIEVQKQNIETEKNVEATFAEKFVDVEKSLNSLISNIRSTRGKLEHKFYKLGLD